ncbi:hypothetical protein LCGC14_2250810 [marine sediment metagenome]|uniref:Amidoligase enzyme n=1 Tax=marine sediment metagenome TaxID=412755 RepID=A0A0F9D2G2_9ZZZZ
MTKIYQIYDVPIKKGKEIGIEIEMEGKNLKTNISKYWRAAADGSLRGNSIEYVLKDPAKRGDTRKKLLLLKQELEDYDCIPELSDRCGVHIHINCQELTTTQVINFSIVYLILENLLLNFCGDERIGNHFCLSSSDAEAVISALRECKEQGKLHSLQSNRYRYASINFSAISKFGSLEFRAFQTPKNLIKIQQWIDILLAIKDYSLEFEQSYDILEHISFNGAQNFLTAVLKENAHLVAHPDMDNLILSGVRRVQEVAYAVEKKKKKKDIYEELRIADHDMGAPQPMVAGQRPRLMGPNPGPAQWVILDEGGVVPEVDEEEPDVDF